MPSATATLRSASPKTPYRCGGWQVLKRHDIVAPNIVGVQCPALQMNKTYHQLKCCVNYAMLMRALMGCRQTFEDTLNNNVAAVRQVGGKHMSYSAKMSPDAISDCDVEECPAEDPYRCGG